MRSTLLLFLAFWAGLVTIEHVSDFNTAYDAGYGALALLAMVIAVTFGWLWRIRATPMALGMAFSWAGCAGLVGYWWYFDQVRRMPVPGFDHLLLWAFLALYLAGAVAHLKVIVAAYGADRSLLYGVVFGALAAAGLTAVAFG